MEEENELSREIENLLTNDIDAVWEFLMTLRNDLNKSVLIDLTTKFKYLPLECDGLTRVLSYVLNEEDFKHTCYRGHAIFNGKSVQHYWIKVDNTPFYIDYRLKMWFGDKEEIPFGVFSDPKKVSYQAIDIIEFHTSKLLFDVLTQQTKLIPYKVIL